MKMYIAVLDEVPDYIVPTLVAHAVLTAHIKFTTTYVFNKDYNNWLSFSFKKCVIKVNKKEFEKIKNLPDICISYEKHTLKGEESCIVVCPREENPNVLKFAKLWKPNYEKNK